MMSREERLIGPGSPFELVGSTRHGAPCKVFRHGPKTLNDLYRRAESFGNRVWFSGGGRALTYRDALAQANSLSHILQQSYGIRAKSRVALVLNTQAQWLVSFIATTSLGAAVVAIPDDWPVEHIVEALERAKCALAITSQPLADALRDCGDIRPVMVARPLGATDVPPLHRTLDVDPESIALIAFTSGSTGAPKGVTLSHASLMNGMMNMLLGTAIAASREAIRAPTTRSSTPASLLCAPLTHVSGYSSLLLSAYVGGRIVAAPADDLFATIARESVTSLVGVTPLLAHELASSGRTFSSLRSISIQGAAASDILLSELAARCPNISVSAGYGMTETNGSICVGSAATLIERHGSCGKVLPTVDVAIRPLRLGVTLPANEGEVWIRGPMLMSGYLAAPKENAAALHRGWFKTGDVGRLDAEGYLYISDRLKQIIVCDGVRISCAAVERAVLETHSAAEAAAFGIADEHRGERLVVVVAPYAGQSCDETQISQRLASSGFAASLAPRIVTLPALPRTSSGKIDRFELQRRVCASSSPQ